MLIFRNRSNPHMRRTARSATRTEVSCRGTANYRGTARRHQPNADSSCHRAPRCSRPCRHRPGKSRSYCTSYVGRRNLHHSCTRTDTCSFADRTADRRRNPRERYRQRRSQSRVSKLAVRRGTDHHSGTRRIASTKRCNEATAVRNPGPWRTFRKQSGHQPIRLSQQPPWSPRRQSRRTPSLRPPAHRPRRLRGRQNQRPRQRRKRSCHCSQQTGLAGRSPAAARPGRAQGCESSFSASFFAYPPG